MKLNLGCEFDRREGWVNLDINPDVKPDVIGDARSMPMFADATFSEIHASHLLEHFYEHEIIPVLKEWNRILIPGGSLTIVVPDVEKVARWWVEGRLTETEVLKGFIGDNQIKSPWMLHKTFFWFSRLKRILEENNFDEIEEFGQRDLLVWLYVRCIRRR